MKVAYLDPVAGVSGDMFVASFLDAGLPLETLREELRLLPLEGYEVSASKVKRCEIPCTRFVVDVRTCEHGHRNLASIERIIEDSGLEVAIKERALHAFRLLAEAESKIHGTAPEEVTFHEVGAVDSIIDIVAASIALVRTGVEELLVGALPTGRGTVDSAHGVLPVPAPATASLLTGFDLCVQPVQAELVTPTGAALIKANGRPLGGGRATMRLESVGYGAGSAEFQRFPNVTRLMLGTRPCESVLSPLDVLETTIDDATPQTFGYIVERLLEAGAHDAFLTPVLMKKTRPGVQLTVLCPPERTDALRRIVFGETPTLGVRVSRQHRYVLDRKSLSVATPFGEISVKVFASDDGPPRAAPEYDSCARAARAHGVPLWKVMEEARRAWEKAFSG